MAGSFTPAQAAGQKFRDHITANPTWGTKGGNVLTHKIDGFTMSQLDQEGEFGQKKLNALINKLSQEVYNRPKSADEIRREQEEAADLARRNAERQQFDQWKLNQNKPQVTPQDIASYNIDASGRTHGKPLEAVRSIEAAKAGTEAIAASVPTATITDAAGAVIDKPVVQTDTGPTTSQSAADITDADGNVIQAGNPLMKAQFEALLQRMTDERQAEERFAQAQNARQDQIRQDQIRQQEITLANAERAGREAFAGTQGPRFIAPHIEGNDPVQAATRRALMSQLSGDKFQAMEAQRMQALEDDADKSREALLGRLSDYGVLTRSGRTIDRLGEFEGQVLRGRGDVRSQMEQLRSQQLANAIEQGRGFREFEVGADLSRAEMINQALAKGSDIDFRRYELQQDVANQAMSRQLALLDPTGREQFQQQIRGQLSEEQLKRTGMDLTRQQYETSKEQFEADRALREGELTGRFGEDGTATLAGRRFEAERGFRENEEALAAARFGEESRQFNLNRMRDAERLRLETRGMGLEEARLEGTLGLEQMRLQEDMRVGNLERMMQRSQFEQDRQLREGALTGQYGTATSLAGQEMAMRRQAQEAELFGYVETDTDDPLVQAGLAPSGKRLTRSEKEAEFEREMMREELGLRRGELTGQYGTEDTLGSQEMALRRAELTGRMGEGADAQQTMAAQQWADEQKFREADVTGQYDGVDTFEREQYYKDLRQRQYESSADVTLRQEAGAREAYGQAQQREQYYADLRQRQFETVEDIALRKAQEARAGTEFEREIGFRGEEGRAGRQVEYTALQDARNQALADRELRQQAETRAAQQQSIERDQFYDTLRQRQFESGEDIKLRKDAEARAGREFTQELGFRGEEGRAARQVEYTGLRDARDRMEMERGFQERAETRAAQQQSIDRDLGYEDLRLRQFATGEEVAAEKARLAEGSRQFDLGLGQEASQWADQRGLQLMQESRAKQALTLDDRYRQDVLAQDTRQYDADYQLRDKAETRHAQQQAINKEQFYADLRNRQFATGEDVQFRKDQWGDEYGLRQSQQEADIRNQSLAMMAAQASQAEGKMTAEARRRQAGLQARLIADSMRQSGQFSDEDIDAFVDNMIEGTKGATRKKDKKSIWERLNPFS